MPLPQTKWEQTVTRAMRTCVRTFGEGEVVGVLFTHASGQSYQVNGIFEATTEEVDLDTGATVMSNRPQVSFALADLQALPNVRDTCLIRDVLYTVVQPNFDGQGTVTLRLHEA